MSNFIIHIVPTDEGKWAVQAQGLDSADTYTTQGLAVARAWEIVQDCETAEVVVYGKAGAIDSNLLVSILNTPSEMLDGVSDAEDVVLRRVAERFAPSRARIKALIRNLPASTIDYSLENDDWPC